MIPWVQLDTAVMPGGGGALRLMQRGEEFSIMAGATELMNSRVKGSEEQLAGLACARIRTRPKPRVLIGGLGMGFTLRAALEEVGADAKVMVAELVPAVVTWARGPLAGLFDGCLEDPRVSIREVDVGQLISAGQASYDTILLDVDNGPEGLTRRENDRLYSRKGLEAARRALRPGGVLAVWSSAQHRHFSSRLRQAGFDAKEVSVRANGARGARYIIWIATNPAQ